MARHKILYIATMLLAMLCSSCSEIDDLNHGELGNEEAWVTIDFGHQSFENIEITTRATVGEAAESRVMDLYALMFVNDKCVYNRYFSSGM